MLSRDISLSAVVAEAKEHLRSVAPSESPALIDRVSDYVEALFKGEHPEYQKADLKYHNFDHTILATQAFVDLAIGRVRHGMKPVFSGRDFSLGYAAILMHDIGYLKTRDDVTGTGAKYTLSHVHRSCAMTAKYLPSLGCAEPEILGVQKAIQCTGVRSKISDIHFYTETQRITGCMVATADYLGQMADPLYPEKLPCLFSEFEESDESHGVPAEKRAFRSLQQLIEMTPKFWTSFVVPKLENDYSGVYRGLSLPDGRNPYLDAVSANLQRIAAMMG